MTVEKIIEKMEFSDGIYFSFLPKGGRMRDFDLHRPPELALAMRHHAVWMSIDTKRHQAGASRLVELQPAAPRSTAVPRG